MGLFLFGRFLCARAPDSPLLKSSPVTLITHAALLFCGSTLLLFSMQWMLSLSNWLVVSQEQKLYLLPLLGMFTHSKYILIAVTVQLESLHPLEGGPAYR